MSYKKSGTFQKPRIVEVQRREGRGVVEGLSEKVAYANQKAARKKQADERRQTQCVMHGKNKKAKKGRSPN